MNKAPKALAHDPIGAETMLRARPWRLRGVPTPRAAHIRNPRFYALT